MTDDLHEAIIEYREAVESFTASKTVDGARRLLKAQNGLQQVGMAIHQTIWTQPVMVHVAGDRRHETDDAGHAVIRQRCTRCGSLLQMWHENVVALTPDGPRELEEDDVEWWDVGTYIAKHQDSGVIGVYVVEDPNALDKHEILCPDLAAELGAA